MAGDRKEVNRTASDGIMRRRSWTKNSVKPVASNTFRLGYLIHDVSRMRRTLVDQYMKPEGITRSQWWVLANLSRHEGEAVVSTELAKLMDVGKVTLGGLLERLEIAGYIYRRPDKIDRRAKQIFISTAGYALISKMRVIVADLNRQIVGGMSDEEVRLIEMHMMKLKDNLRNLLGEIPPDGD